MSVGELGILAVRPRVAGERRLGEELVMAEADVVSVLRVEVPGAQLVEDGAARQRTGSRVPPGAR